MSASVLEADSAHLSGFDWSGQAFLEVHGVGAARALCLCIRFATLYADEHLLKV